MNLTEYFKYRAFFNGKGSSGGGTTPTGTLSLSYDENGTYTADCKNYASVSVEVDVAGSSDYGVATVLIAYPPGSDPLPARIPIRGESGIWAEDKVYGNESPDNFQVPLYKGIAFINIALGGKSYTVSGDVQWISTYPDGSADFEVTGDGSITIQAQDVAF